MRTSGLLLASMALAVLLVSGVAFAQEAPLPDLTVEKTGLETVTADAYVRHQIEVTNIGDAPFVAESDSFILLRDEMRIHGRYTAEGWNFQGRCGGTYHYAPSETFYASGDRYCETRPGQTFFDQLAPGESTGGYYWYVYMISGGRVTDCATVDPYNEIAESDESNNTDCFTTTVRGDNDS